LGKNKMSDLRELYQQVIIDHGRNPRNFGCLDQANHVKEGYNPLCGDRLTVYLLEKDGFVQDSSFEGSGCAISIASASLMTEALKGKTIHEVKSLFDHFHHLVTSGDQTAEEKLGKLAVLGGVSVYPMRVKCATLCWHTTLAAINNKELSEVL